MLRKALLSENLAGLHTGKTKRKPLVENSSGILFNMGTHCSMAVLTLEGQTMFGVCDDINGVV